MSQSLCADQMKNSLSSVPSRWWYENSHIRKGLLISHPPCFLYENDENEHITSNITLVRKKICALCKKFSSKSRLITIWMKARATILSALSSKIVEFARIMKISHSFCMNYFKYSIRETKNPNKMTYIPNTQLRFYLYCFSFCEKISRYCSIQMTHILYTYWVNAHTNTCGLLSVRQLVSITD